MKNIIIAIIGGGVFVGSLFALNGFVVDQPLTKCEQLEEQRLATNQITKRIQIVSAMVELECPQLNPEQ